MPHVRRSVLVTIDAPSDAVREALDAEATLTASGDGSLTGPFTPSRSRTTLVARLEPHGDDGSTVLRLEAQGNTRCRSSAGSSGFQAWLAARGALKHLAARVRARVEGRDSSSAAAAVADRAAGSVHDRAGRPPGGARVRRASSPTFVAGS